ncbi:TetR/AcrR family transcriptional regulator [Chitinophaga pinensis]|uniref:Transcriptional regulator, TetR family n=1 Tax=Chitinophaga pinensis (strain ATCC 43595 / DSM 2588 / LMG 13176 / NBRC 15968 / NCIMB 11800 / UQM 2034) TaxID=485918 RepID=A0A979FZM0_CHIPD|nr:TetR/AcrR family transcriptional regulator [Chitinophaga pinensis]ACU58058.1 transcriptional regulator, TetR family [Chitinophaga pinensis DSM 2588]
MEYNPKQLLILESAEKLFASHGFHATSVRDIAHEAGVNIAMISYYFGSKEKLIESIFLKRIINWKAILNETLKDNSKTYIERLDSLIENFVRRIIGNPCFNLMMMRAQIQADMLVNDLIHESKKEVYEVIGAFINAGQEQGVFNKDVDVLMMVATLTGTTNHIMSTRHHFQRMSNLEHLSDSELQEYLIIHTSNHLKNLFKAILIHEA